MPIINKYLIRELAGLNEGNDPTAIADNEFARLENMYPFGKRLIRRNGYVLNTGGGAWDQTVLSMFAYKESVGTWTLLVFGNTGIAKVSGSSFSDIPALSGAFTSDTGRYTVAQYKDTVYFARSTNGTLYRTDGLSQGVAGISAPTTAAVLAQGAAGDLGAGDYIGVVTYYNSATGAESDPGPLSNTLTLGASKKIDWTAIPTSTNPQVDSRRVYRTLADQTGEYYLVTTINDNTTTTLTEEVIQDDMGDQASFDNGTPPSVAAYIGVWNERLWVSDGTDLYFSEFGLPESFSSFSVISVNPDDGHTINGILPFGDLLLVGKTNATYYIIGTDESDFTLQTLSDKFGCVSQQSMKVAEGRAFWFGGDNFYTTDGNTVKAIGDIHLRNILDGIDSTYYNLVTGAIDDKNGWYIAGIPEDGASSVNAYLVYNYRTDQWCKFTFTGTAPSILADFYDANAQSVLYCAVADGNVYTFNSGNTDNGTAIPVDILTKKFGIERDDILKFVRDAQVYTNDIDNNLQVDVWTKGSSAASVTINLGETVGEWSSFALCNRGAPSEYAQLRFQYTGTRQLQLKGFGLKVIDLNRRTKKVSPV